MPKRRKPASARPTSIQLPLFAETASLVRIRPALYEWRYYRMEVWPDLFGRALLVRQWGRIGTEGRRRLDPHPDPVPRSTPLLTFSGPSAAAAIRTAPGEGAKSAAGTR
jgi:predicted DNA-binding WGR domain protein